MTEPREDDLFRESTMTFGQHLEELRGCLFKSLLGLGLAFIVGLMVGGKVVQFIQKPLTRALTSYYQKESTNRVESELEKWEQSDRPLPWTSKEAVKRIEEEQLLAEEVYVDPREMLQELNRFYPGQFKNAAPTKPTQPYEDGGHTSADADTGKLMRLFLWHRSTDDPRVQIKSLNAQEAFSVYVKASLLTGVLLASPWIFYQIWHFVAAGLYPRERRYVYMYLPFSLGLFLLGAALAFFVVFKPVLEFLLGFNRYLGMAPEPRINEWLGFVMLLPVGFGVGFQLPLVMFFLERIGVFTVKNYVAQWRIAVLVIFVLAGILAPPDPYSMLLMAVPLSFLYFGGIFFCKVVPRKPGPFENAG